MCPDTNSPEDSGKSYEKQPSDLSNQTSGNSGPGAYKPHVCPLNRSCRAECRAWQTGSLDGALRWFAKHHNWHDPGHLANQLKILLVFKKAVRAAANKLLAIGLDGLAAQIKKEFKRLLEMCQPLDAVRGRLIAEEDEAIKLEHTRAHLIESLLELAELVEIGQKTVVRGQGSQRPGELNPQERDAVAGLEKPQSSRKIMDIPPADDDEPWITVTAAAGLLKKDLGTICHWADIGKVRDNGKKKYQRRILKADILLIKQATEEKDAKKDREEERRDNWKMDREL
jgi:hypothetical protein